MNSHPFHLNLITAWAGILFGFLSGMIMGLFFHRENWLGGYGSLKRRMYRLAHISLFGLGAVNLMFWLTARGTGIGGSLAQLAAWSFIVGAISMPLCCVVMAHFPKLHMIFAVPVISLLVGAVLTLTLIVCQQDWKQIAAVSRSTRVPPMSCPQGCNPPVYAAGFWTPGSF